MTLAPIAAIACGLFLAAYLIYGRLLSRLFGLDRKRLTPAHTLKDGVDFAPAKAPMLLAQHFSAISAAGPIVGPILAGLWFGWLPALLWIVFGSIFMGAVHDYTSLVGSIRHKASSVAEIIREHVGARAYKFFVAFVWLSLVYVITAFTDITSASFVEPQFGGRRGHSLDRLPHDRPGPGNCAHQGPRPACGWPPWWLFLWSAPPLPGAPRSTRSFPHTGWIRPQLAWNFIILGYCFIASLIPLWLLVQPRGYLGGFFLYGTLAGGIVGVFSGRRQNSIPGLSRIQSHERNAPFPHAFRDGGLRGLFGVPWVGGVGNHLQTNRRGNRLSIGGIRGHAV
jgi:carbon starvation protein